MDDVLKGGYIIKDRCKMKNLPPDFN